MSGPAEAWCGCWGGGVHVDHQLRGVLAGLPRCLGARRRCHACQLSHQHRETGTRLNEKSGIHTIGEGGG